MFTTAPPRSLTALIISLYFHLLLGFIPSVAAASFHFDMPAPGTEIALPLTFSDGATTLEISASTQFWRQTDQFTAWFPGLSGGVITNGLRLAEYPAETLTLSFNQPIQTLTANYAVGTPGERIAYQLTLDAYLDTTLIESLILDGEIQGSQMEAGTLAFSSADLYDRVLITASAGIDLAIDDVVVTPIPGTALLLATALPWLLLFRSKRFIQNASHQHCL